MDKQKRYLFSSYVDFNGAHMTGAHRRFLELMARVAVDNKVIFVGNAAPCIDIIQNVTVYPINTYSEKRFPKHLTGAYSIYKALKKNSPSLLCDYAISFSPIVSICYRLVGIKHIISLFREDLIGYQNAIHASKKKLLYFQIQERLAVLFSEKVIVQCTNDKLNLIRRNQRYCKNIEDKVFVQINNANASWMKTYVVPHVDDGDTPKILFIGNFSDCRKGHSLLLPAAIRLLQEGFRFELFCAGDGYELARWKDVCEEYSDIQFLGHTGDLGKYLAQADMMLVPSIIDSCPNTLLEGLNAGMAVYGSKSGGIPDLLREDRYLFEPNENSIYSFLKNVLETGCYKHDAIHQRVVKENLCFDWGNEIIKIIEM